MRIVAKRKHVAVHIERRRMIVAARNRRNVAAQRVERRRLESIVEIAESEATVGAATPCVQSGRLHNRRRR